MFFQTRYLQIALRRPRTGISGGVCNVSSCFNCSDNVSIVCGGSIVAKFIDNDKKYRCRVWGKFCFVSWLH